MLLLLQDELCASGTSRALVSDSGMGRKLLLIAEQALGMRIPEKTPGNVNSRANTGSEGPRENTWECRFQSKHLGVRLCSRLCFPHLSLPSGRGVGWLETT